MKTSKETQDSKKYRKVIVLAEVSENDKGYVSLNFKSRNSTIWIKAEELVGYEANVGEKS